MASRKVILATLTEEQQYEPKGKSNLKAGTLTTTIQVRKHADHESIRRLEVEFLLKTGKQKKGPEIGHLIAWFVDMSKPEKGKAAWISELIASKKTKSKDEESDDDETHRQNSTEELCNSLSMLYTKAGAPRKALNEYEAALTTDRLIYIDTFFLEEPYRGKGLAQLAMQSFHSLVPYVNLEGEAEAPLQTTLVLSPARSDDHEVDNDKTDVEVERGLIKSYKKSEYEVWIQGGEDVPGSATIMGRVVGEQEQEEEVGDVDEVDEVKDE